MTDPFPTHHRAVLEAIADLSARARPFTLCLVVHSTGSTYRKAGALALVAGDGRRCGVLSGGCLESDLESAAASVLAQGRPRLAIYDTRDDDDELFGSGSGCRGRMQVLLLPVTGGVRHPLCEALLAAERAHEVLRAAILTRGRDLGGGFAWSAGGETVLVPRVEALRALKERAPGEHRLADDSACAVLAIPPSPRLLLLGAGPEAPALLRIAGELGWRVGIADHREAVLRSRGEIAERVICAPPAEALAQLRGERFDACIVMTHTAAHDRAALAVLARRDDPFVGLLGPPARRDELLGSLEPAAREALSPRLHAPVGLDLGAYGPEALALAICAELQRFLARGE